MKVFGVVGWKNSGKTTLTVRLVEALRARGLNVATIKHSHSSRQMDVPGTDTHRHREAGAQSVTLVAEDGWTQLRHGEDPALEGILALHADADVVVAEGFKQSPWPKIACAADDDLSVLDEARNVTALATATALEHPLPVFSRDDVEAIVTHALTVA